MVHLGLFCFSAKQFLNQLRMAKLCSLTDENKEAKGGRGAALIGNVTLVRPKCCKNIAVLCKEVDFTPLNENHFTAVCVVCIVMHCAIPKCSAVKS